MEHLIGVCAGDGQQICAGPADIYTPCDVGQRAGQRNRSRHAGAKENVARSVAVGQGDGIAQRASVAVGAGSAPVGAVRRGGQGQGLRLHCAQVTGHAAPVARGKPR